MLKYRLCLAESSMGDDFRRIHRLALTFGMWLLLLLRRLWLLLLFDEEPVGERIAVDVGEGDGGNGLSLRRSLQLMTITNPFQNCGSL